MAYDSATDTALAGQAYQKALAVAAQRRTQLQTQHGLNADGTLDNSAAGRLGDVYQTGLQGAESITDAEGADRRRGFGFAGGLAGKMASRAQGGALQAQARVLQGAASDFGDVGAAELQAGTDYESDKGNISKRSDFDFGQTLAANPVLAPAAPTPPVLSAPAPALSPAMVLARKKALAANPRIAQTARNSY